MVRSLGPAWGPKLLRPPAWRLPQDSCRRARSAAPSPTKAGKTVWHQERLGCLNSLGEIKMKWETHRGGAHPLGLWTPARSLPEKLDSQVIPGEGKSWAVWDPDLDSLWCG